MSWHYLDGVLQCCVLVVWRLQGLYQGAVHVAAGLYEMSGQSQLLLQHVIHGGLYRLLRC